MDKITYKGKDYPVRTFIVIEDDGAETQRTISVESLSEAIGIDDNYDGTLGEVEDNIDQSIYYYVEDEVILLEAKEICEDYLDIPMTFVEEIFGYMD